MQRQPVTGGGRECSGGFDNILPSICVISTDSRAPARTRHVRSTSEQITNQANNMRMVQFTVRFQF